ncbi:ABC transporter ATP-binding protein [Microbacterium lushaniae]|nr:ABC transporter ATP-binding protein [Microbacterium lushaniae]KAA9159861.1 ABC transporter ATP-binding protein [Microbacterium lushaniae]
MDRLLRVDGLRVDFDTQAGLAHALNGVSFDVGRGELLAIIGESGSGKSVTAQTIMRILDQPPGRIVGGQVVFDGVDLLQLPEKEMRAYRGDRISMIFQDALSSLNPVICIGDQIAEVFQVHRGMSRQDGRKRAVELMNQVGIPAAARRASEFPHQFSGGLRQRAMIAMALALDPELLIADEPTTALDVTIQAQILELIDSLRRERNMAVILITHDVGVVREVADRSIVMYGGRIVEAAPTQELFDSVAHPYTQVLLDSIPRWSDRGRRLRAAVGSPPALTALPSGCAFHPRCPVAIRACATDAPPTVHVSADHLSVCHLAKETADVR